MVRKTPILALVCFGLAGLSAAAEPGVGLRDQEKALMAKVLALHDVDLYAGSAPLSKIVDAEQLRETLIRGWGSATAGDRARLLSLLTNIAREASVRGSPRGATDMEIASVLVAALDDSDGTVRSHAAGLLERDFDESAVRFFQKEIVDRVEKHNNTDSLLLLGRLDSTARILKLLQSEPFRRASERNSRAALAKLGDAAHVQDFIAEFRNAKDAREKAECARVLGYIGNRACCEALAQELRSPLSVQGGAEYSFRVVIIESLARALPWEKTLWPPATPPTDDSYYQRIERWAERVLGVSWKSPRPPFMYVIPRPGKGGRLPE